jgi:hypothetical protein
MSEGYQPTNYLRWWQPNDWQQPVLQQKWVSDYAAEKDEWRDVPTASDLSERQS